uniref:Pigment dispersing hormone 3 n=1 Tax=Nephrops norvegicus TaxID=6829 RepID=A0A4D6BQ35_NEPNO|nr:pigment dispersing hormone 3 [Nephrops norvegicus]
MCQARGVSTMVNVGVSLAALLMLALVTSHPLWVDEQTEGGEGLVPLVFVPLSPHHHQVVREPVPKRNSEILNTLLGSQDLSNMRSAGRR